MFLSKHFDAKENKNHKQKSFMVHPFIKMYMIHTFSYTFNLLYYMFPRKKYMFNTFGAKKGQEWTHYIKKHKNYMISFFLYIFHRSCYAPTVHPIFNLKKFKIS